MDVKLVFNTPERDVSITVDLDTPGQRRPQKIETQQSYPPGVFLDWG